MSRVYLLLRENIESGPYTFDELLQQQLRSSDLIWIEGETLAWIYPYEIEDLRKSLTGKTVEPVSFSSIVPSSTRIERPLIEKPAMESKGPSTPIPSKPLKKSNDEIEKRAEELRKKALAFSSQHEFNRAPILKAIHDFQPHLNERDAVNFVHHKPNKGLPVGEVLVAAMIVALVLTGWYGGANKYLFNRKAPEVNSVATQLVASDMHAAAAPKKSSEPVADTARSFTDTISNNFNQVPSYGRTQPIQRKNVAAGLLPDSQATEKKSELAVQNNLPDSQIKDDTKTVATEKKQVENNTIKEPEKKQPITEEKKSPDIKKEADTKAPVTQEEDKKKTIGDVFKGLFKKKHKN